MRKKISLVEITSHLRIMASPHYYTGRSAGKLFLHNILRFVAFLRTPKPERELILQTTKFKNCMEGKVALLIAGGPSVDSLNIQAIKSTNCDIFAMNGYNRFSISDSLIPDFYCLSDPLHFAPKDLKGAEEVRELEDYLFEHEIALIAPHTAAKSEFFHSSKKIYFDDRELTFLRKNVYPDSPRAYSSTTFYKMLAMACYFGYQEIYLIGLENSNFKNYVGNINNQIVDLGGETALRNSENISALIGPSEVEFTSGMAGRMQSYSHLFGDLKLFRKHQIINLSEKSLVDVFRKVNNSYFLIGNNEKN